MDMFEIVERLKYLSSVVKMKEIKSDDKKQIAHIKEIRKLIKTIEIERVDMSTIDKWEFHD